MNDRLFLRLLRILAAVAIVSGVAMAMRSIGSTREHSAKMDGKLRYFEELRLLEAEINRYTAALGEFEKLPAGSPTPIAKLLRENLPGHTSADIRELKRSAAAQGWTVHRQEIAFSEISLADAMRFAGATESQRPPWRLVKCDIRASSQAPASGQVVLVLESLQKGN